MSDANRSGATPFNWDGMCMVYGKVLRKTDPRLNWKNMATQALSATSGGHFSDGGQFRQADFPASASEEPETGEERNDVDTCDCGDPNCTDPDCDVDPKTDRVAAMLERVVKMLIDALRGK